MISKKASVKAIEYCSKLTGEKLKLNSSWSDLSWIFLEGYIYDVKTGLETTTISLYKEPGEKEDILESWNIPNEEVYDKKLCDWDWNYIYKLLFEWISKKRKPKAKKVKKQSYDELVKDVSEIKIKIKNATGKEKKNLIKEYNEKSKELEKLQSKKDADNQVKEQIEQDKETLKKKAFNLYQRIRDWQKKGKDASELIKEREEILNKLK